MDDRTRDVTNYDENSTRTFPADPTSTAPKRRGRPPKVRLPEGVVRAAEDLYRVGGELNPEPPKPLLTLHLRRAGNEITDATGKVHIPASGAIPDGTKLVAHFYREE